MRWFGHRPERFIAGALLLTALAVGSSLLFGRSGSTSGLDRAPAGLLGGAPATASPSATDLPACARPTLVGTLALDRVTARTAPLPTASAVASFNRINPQGAPQVFDLESSVDGPNGDLWYRALLPIRPNGTSGFLPASALLLAADPYRIVIDRERLSLTLWNGCAMLRTFSIGLGKESTPTPNGRFYIISLLKPPTAGSIYGPYAYGLSAFSDAITNWTGGGVIGIHGTNDPSSIGNRRSHGCIRMRNQDIEALVPILPLGTPVDIR